MAKKPKLVMPANATPEFLIDELGRLRDEIKERTDLQDFYKAGLKARAKELNVTTITGEKYVGEYVDMERSGIPIEAVRAHTTKEWQEENTVITAYTQLNIKEIE